MSFVRRGWYGNKRNYRSAGRGNSRMQVMRVNPEMLVRKAQQSEAREYLAANNFHDFEITQKLKERIVERGYMTPTPIQDQIIPHVLRGRDVIGLASTGTGKTAAFLIPLINKIMMQDKESVLIIAPTRELALQIEDELHIFVKGMRIYSTLCIGGVPINKQIAGVKRNPHFIIGTPGRIKDLEERRILKLSGFGTIVLDEVDRMLDMGFVHDVRAIIAKLPTPRQSLFFSATMTNSVKEIARELLTDPATIKISEQGASLNVEQDVVKVMGRNKIELLHELLIKPEYQKVLVFGRTKHGIERLTQELVGKGFSAVAIHGNKSQSQRQRALQIFREGRAKIMLATDVAARGLDIEDISHVVNYELPATYEDYIHRIGRTGRANKKGYAITLVD